MSLKLAAEMSIYIIRRLLLVIPTVFLVSLVVFVSVRLMPGDIVDLLLSEQGSVSVTAHREQIEELLGLNVPAHVQYLRWMRGIFLEGNLGQSLRSSDTFTTLVLHRLPVTLELGALTLLMLLIPAAILAMILADQVMRMTRTMMLEALR